MKQVLYLTTALLAIGLCLPPKTFAQLPRSQGIAMGVLKTGKNNDINDVAGVRVGQVTLVQGDSVRTGVTAIIPHSGNIFQEKVPAAVYIGNGFGKMTGFSQIEELGNLESPLVLTNTLSVAPAIEGILDYLLAMPDNEGVRSVNAVVGETNDGGLNDIRGRHIQKAHVREALQAASTDAVQQGNVGAGTGTVCFGFKGGIGSASRKVPGAQGGYTVGVLVQANFGGVLQINGVPVGERLKRYAFAEQIAQDADGSCMMVVATDAPLDARNLKRLAKRAMLGLARTGGIASNGSGDFVIAFSTAQEVRETPFQGKLVEKKVLHNDAVSGLFLAAIEATEEAIVNALFAAETMVGYGGKKIEAIPKDQVMEWLKKHQGK